MNLIFLNSATLVKKELLKAFKKRAGITLINLEIPPRPKKSDIDIYFSRLKQYLPGIVFSINNAGYDVEGVFFKQLKDSGSLFINWYHDEPFYESIYFNRKIYPDQSRIDFISEPAFETPLRKKDYRNVFYLPLATDPDYFNINGTINFEREISFVGNSTLELMDFIIDNSVYAKIEKNPYIIKELSNLYASDPTFDIDSYIEEKHRKYLDLCKNTKERNKLLFATKWFISYQYRKNFLSNISSDYKDKLTIFGDPYWANFISNSHISTKACYYDNLCKYYRSTKINLNLNRIQIRTAFTQRPFDVKLSGAFLLTEKRPMNSSVFVTDGPNREIVEFSSIDECKRLIDFYLTNSEEREKIGLAGRERILKNHTYDNRVNEMLAIAQEVWK